MDQHQWQHCAICHEPTQQALCGNRFLSRWSVWLLPREQVPAVSWRCKQHARYKKRTATAVRAGALGDLIFTLACSHEVHWVFRGEGAYTPARVEQALTTRQIRLDRPQRCYLCGDLEQERAGQW